MARKRSATSPPPPAATDEVRTVSFVSLGCPKNLVDSEKMLGLLAEDGLIVVPESEDADAVVINTCGFLEASKDESLEEIQAAAKRKRAGQLKRIIVAGCLVQRHRAKMLEWCPDIDALIGVFDRDRIVQAVRTPRKLDPAAKSGRGAVALPVYSSIAASALAAKRERGIQGNSGGSGGSGGGVGYFESDAARLRLTPRHYAYLRISEGCNQNCAFCTIPSIRGKMRSKPVDAVLAELRELMADGAFELNLIGQDTTSYGIDIHYHDPAPNEGLVGLLTALDREAAAQGGAWLRLMYAYPSCFSDRMIDAIAALPNVVKYIDMPLQHINDQVLDRMRRRTSRKLIETLLAKLRDRVPGLAIRTTMITGFPGETDAQHRELVDFIRDFSFDNLGVFPYSPEPGTPAGSLHARGKAIPQDIIQERIDQIMSTQQAIVFARHQALAQSRGECQVLIDAPLKSKGKATAGVGKGGQLYQGRTPAQAPQIDGVTFVQSKHKLAPGEVVACRITAADGYDLIAAPSADLDAKLSLPVMR
jgi:ribosomal protein S12 methylthiotransferase